MHCPDQTGIIASVTSFINKNGGNIVGLDQYVEPSSAKFFMRIEWELENFKFSNEQIENAILEDFGKKFQIQYRLHFNQNKRRMAVFVSKISHCLSDILARWQSDEWNVEIPLIISNHEDMRAVVEPFGIPYFYLPITASNKAEQESKQAALLDEYKIDFVVLARYMQVLSEDFIKYYPENIINIHHSSLPAFPGAKPYHSAFERGVKIIGATAHYVTEKLDEGPIIEQEVVRVSHLDSVADLVRKGKDLEKIALSKAIWLHLNNKILCYKNKTIVFD